MRVLIFGLGQMGKKVIDECIEYDLEYEIQAIVDNHSASAKYRTIPVIRPDEINNYEYEWIFICTVYYNEIIEQLHDIYGIEKSKMRFVEPVAPVLESRLRDKYREAFDSIGKQDLELQEVLGYLEKNSLRMYCYPFYDEFINRKTDIFYDENVKLFYGIYNNNKMYLARRYDTEQKARMYFNSVVMEQDERSPHCYWNYDNMRDVSGIGIDVGAAEGIFGLKIIEHVKFLYILEMDKEWLEALNITFAPFNDKVKIINCFVGNDDKGLNCKLDTLFGSTTIDFIKMDIEGKELEALKGAKNLLKINCLSLCICSYHNADDNYLIKEFLVETGYKCIDSKGLVICMGEWELDNKKADFRKCLIFAERIKE